VPHIFDFPSLFHHIRGICNGDYYAPLREILDLKAGDSLLEVGCGTGGGSVLAGPGIEYVGIDTDRTYVNYANRHYGRAGVIFKHVDVHAIQGTYSKAVVMCTLHHLSDDEVRSLGSRLREIVSGPVAVADPDPVESRGIQKMILRCDRGRYVRPIPDHLRLLDRSYRCHSVLTKDLPRLRLARLTYSRCDPLPS
jgi:SAM-dependent methyltransferase